MSKLKVFVLIACLSFLCFACQRQVSIIAHEDSPSLLSNLIAKPKLSEIKNPNIRKVLESANEQTETTTEYSQKYYTIEYPLGDVPEETGACTDVVVRSFRAAGVDLQKEVHEDMRDNFAKYPTKWGLEKPDTNIDHRRVLNLQVFFQRKGKSLPITKDGANYKPGDVVSWDLNGESLTHIGVVSNIWNSEAKRYLIIHNIGSGAKLEDRLFEWEITGHYRYF